MKKIRQIIRKFLFEAHGIQISVHEFSKEIATDMLGVIEDNFIRMNNGREWKFEVDFQSPETIKKDTKINIVKIGFTFISFEVFKVSGSFDPNRTVLLTDDNYNVFIKLEIETNTIENVLQQIESVVSHELNHAFVHIKGLSGKLKAKNLNYSNKFTRGELKTLIDKTPALKEFTKMIYMANPYEVQSRVQQSALELKYIDKKEAKDTIDALLQYAPLRDAKMMISYNLDEINKVDGQILENFVKKFNDNIKSASKEENPKTIYKVDKFFDYWKDVINNAGDKLARKIYKIVADKHQIHEGCVYELTDGGAYNIIFGESYGYNSHG